MLEGYFCPEIPSVEDTIGSSKYHEYNLERFLYCNIFNGWLLHIPANNPCIFKTRTSLAINGKKLHVYRNKSRVGQQLFTATVKKLEELDKY